MHGFLTGFFIVVGMIGFLALAAGCLAAGWGYAVEKTEKFLYYRRLKIEEQAGKRLGERIAADSCWFSEDVSAMQAIECAGRHIARNGTFNVDSVRDEWRRTVKHPIAKARGL